MASSGGCGARTSASASGAPSARTTATTGEAWDYFSHDHARSRAYRWGEDGLAGISDDKQRLCFALALWNGRDPILKERLFGLTNSEGNHGEDVKEYYFYLDNLPTHSYQRWLYKYPQAPYPYDDLVTTNRTRVPPGARVRAGRHRDLRRAAVLRRHGRVRQGRPVRHRLPHHRRQPRSGGARSCTSCRRSGSATPGRGRRTRSGRACGGIRRSPVPCVAEHADLGRYELHVEQRRRAGARAPVLREREQRPAVVGRRSRRRRPTRRTASTTTCCPARPPSTRTAKGRSAPLISASPCPRAERSCCAAG